MPMSKEPEERLEVISQPHSRFLFNRSDIALERTRIVDYLVATEPGYVYPSPTYEIRDVPPRSYVALPDENRYLDGAQGWVILEAEWEDEKSVEEPRILYETKKWSGAEFAEEEVERELRYLGTVPSHRAGEPPEEMEDMGALYARQVKVYRDTKHRILLLNEAYVGAKAITLAQYTFEREKGRWPDGKDEAVSEEIQIHDMPARSYTPIVEDLNSNRERYEYELLGAEWEDAERFSETREMAMANPVRSMPLSERGLTPRE